MAYSSFPPGFTNLYQCIPSSGIQACMNPFACKLKVEGRGIIQVQPDMAEVILGVVTENKELRPAQEENAAKTAEVLRVLRTMGIDSEDIQTQFYNIAPQYDYIEEKQVFRGYRVEHMLKVIVRDMDRVGEIIDAAVKSGANKVNSINFSVSDPSMHYQRALNAAVDDALAKARTLGNKLDIRISQVPVQIIEVGYELGINKLSVMYEAAVPVTPIQTGTIELIARIEAIFAYSPKLRQHSF